MTSFRCIAMSTAEAARLRRAARDDFGHAVQRFDLDRTYPCRHCLREASGKAGMLLLEAVIVKIVQEIFVAVTKPRSAALA